MPAALANGEGVNQVLDIWVNGTRAAEIRAEAGTGFRLQYTQNWLQYAQRFPFSPHLPMDSISGGAEVRNFFANLLPEGAALEVAASMHNLSRHDAFGLLAKIGREAAGALVIVPADEVPELPIILRPLPLTELSQRIRARPQLPFSAWDGKVRLSIAGYQDKLAVFVDESGQLFLPDGSASSTHIVKPDNINPQFRFMPANEYFCMRLAKVMNLPVPEVTLLHIPDALYQVRRFDRWQAGDEAQTPASGKTAARMRELMQPALMPEGSQDGARNPVMRLHQIDLCQVLNLPVEMKYQQAYEFSPQGASCTDLFHAAESTTQPALAKMALLRWVVFNYLIGNTDAHAKNVSFYLDQGGLRLAPFYDLVCGTIYSLKNLALFIGQEEEIGLVSAADWVEFCRQIALPPALLATELKTQVKLWQKGAAKLLDEVVYLDDERAFLRAMLAGMAARVALMQEQAALLMQRRK